MNSINCEALKERRENRRLHLVHSVDPLEAECNRLTGELTEATALVRRMTRESEEVTANLHAAKLSAHRKGEALDLVLRQLGATHG